MKPETSKKLDDQAIRRLLDIKESYELPEKLLPILLDKRSREDLFCKFLQYDADMSHDLLRDYFQANHAARSQLKQDYTPDCLCDLIARLMPETKRIVDICAGTGALTIAANKNCYVQCEELSEMSIAILLFNLAIRGINATVLKKDVLTQDIKKIYLLKKDGQFSDIQIAYAHQEQKSKVVVSNPPYSLGWEPKPDERFERYQLAPKGAADYAFVLDGLSRLTDDGVAFYILPTGVLFRGNSEGKIRRQLLEENLIDAVIGLPDNLFLNTSIPVCVIVFKKQKATKDVLFIDSSKNFEKKSKQNVLTGEHISRIVDVYRSRRTVDKFSCVATMDMIEANDYCLNIPRYVDTYEAPVIPTIEEITKDIINARLAERKTEQELLKMLSELGGDKLYNRAKAQFVEFLSEQDIVGETMVEWMRLSHYEKVADDIARHAKKVKKSILELTDFERCVKGKVYKSGSIYIQLSATDGKVRYLFEDGELETKYGVFLPKDEYEVNAFLFYALEFEMPSFLARYQCGMNINPDIFKFLEITYFTEREDKVALVQLLEELKCDYQKAEQEKEGWEDFKKYHLDGMFPPNN